jgi:glycosyltransferase involved in cell wall biosynthesis
LDLYLDETAETDGVQETDTRPGGLRLLVTVTFNANQLKAHLLPLIALDEVESITLVADVPPPELPKLREYVPSVRARRALGRAGAKLALCRRLARAERFDWVMGFNLVPHGLSAVHVGKLSGSRSLYHMIGGEREWLGGGFSGSNSVLSRLPRPVPLLERWLLGQMAGATLVATMGPGDRELVVGLGLDPARVVVIPPSTDVDRFRPADGAPRRYAAACVAALIGLKRVRDFIDAAARLRSRHPEARYAIAGDGPLRAELELHASSVGLGDRVDFLGHVDEVEALYAATRAFVLPSEHEGMPIGVIDAMAAGVPVVVSDVGEVASAVRHGGTGFLFRPGDVAALAGHLDVLLSDDGLADSLGAAARETAVSYFSVEAVAARYRALLVDR